MAKEDASAIWIAGLVVAVAVPFLAYFNFVLNHFYRYGAVLLDTGLLADLAWHKPFWLPMAPVFGGQSFYAFHVSPLLSLLSMASEAFPLGIPQWFAVFTGAAHGLSALAVFLALRYRVGLRGVAGAAAASVLAILFAFNGLALAQVRYPHFEILIVSGMMLFLVAWLMGWTRRALAALALCLICREDAGLHVTALLLTVAILDRLHGVKRPRPPHTWVFMALASGYSLLALIAAHLVFPGSSSFIRVYLGDPPFKGLTPEVIANRVVIILYGRAYLVLSAVVAAIWAVATRNIYVFAGYLACVPWGMVTVLAQSGLAAQLDFYYAFPFMVAAFWPVICVSSGGGRTIETIRTTIVGFALMTLASFSSLGLQHNRSRVPLWSHGGRLRTVADLQDRGDIRMGRDRSPLGRPSGAGPAPHRGGTALRSRRPG